MSKTNTFEGLDAVRDYLISSMSPPMLRLPPHLNPFHEDGLVVQALLPVEHSLKLITAYYMLKDAREKGFLDGVHTLVENSSGNTVKCLGLWAPYFGIKKVIAVVASDLATGKDAALKRHGIEIRSVPPDSPINGIALAEELGKQPGHFNPHQYKNVSNVWAHYTHTGPFIDRQTDGKVRIAAITVGTSGTLGGVSRYFREKLGREKFTAVGVICKPGAQVPGVRTREKLKQISFDWESFGDHFVEVDTDRSYFTSQRLDANGIPAGPSSGMAYWGLLEFFAAEKAAGNLDKYRDSEDGKIHAAVIFPDDLKNYWDKYSTIAQFEYFGADKNITFPV